MITDAYEAALASAPYYVPGPLDPRTLYLIFQDKIFFDGANDPDYPEKVPGALPGDLWYAHTYETPGRWDQGPTAFTLPDPSVIPEFFGDTILVNGTVFPYVEVEQRQYRLRTLNACNARFLNPRLYYADGTGTEANLTKPGPAFIQIASEGGFLPYPAYFNTAGQKQLLMAPAERADLIVDFRNVPAGSVLILYSDAPSPFPTWGSAQRLLSREPGHTQFEDGIRPEHQDPASDPRQSEDRRCRSPDPASQLLHADGPVPHLPEADRGGALRADTVRADALRSHNGCFGHGFHYPGKRQAGGGKGPAADPERGFRRIRTADPVPRHQCGDRSRAGIRKDLHFRANGGRQGGQLRDLGDRQPHGRHAPDPLPPRQRPDPLPPGLRCRRTTPARRAITAGPTAPDFNELGWKETVRMNPGEVTRVLMKFDLPAVPFTVPASPRTGGNEYVWHCHILEHEEHDMMRPLVVV